VDLDTRWHASSVWMEAVGWQGYYNEARVYDEVGLVDRNVFDLVAKYRCGYFMAGLRTLKPQFIVKRKFEVDGNKMMIPPQQCPGAPLWANDAERAEFDRMYRVAATYDTQTPEAFGGFSHLVLFQRQDTQAATAQ
jgi:hypothetical protein